MEKISFTNYKLEARDPNYRRQLIKELYDIYRGQKENRRKENWKRYVAWLKENAYSDNESRRNSFRKSRRFLSELNSKTFSIRLASIQTQDLHWVISNVKERREKGIAWLFWSIKTSKEIKP